MVDTTTNSPFLRKSRDAEVNSVGEWTLSLLNLCLPTTRLSKPIVLEQCVTHPHLSFLPRVLPIFSFSLDESLCLCIRVSVSDNARPCSSPPSGNTFDHTLNLKFLVSLSPAGMRHGLLDPQLNPPIYECQFLN